MSRLSIPMDRDALRKFNERVPWGLRHHLIRGLINIALTSDEDILRIAVNEGADYSLIRKETSSESDRRVETGKE